MNRTPALRRVTTVVCCLALAVTAACSGDDDDSADSTGAPDATTTTEADAPADAAPIIFNGQGNDLAAYTSEPPFEKQIVIHHRDDEHPEGLDINAEICFDPENPRRFVAGEDTEQDTTGHPGWGIFELEGDEVGELSATQIAKLVPTYQESTDNSENYGCGFLPDGRIITTDIGNQAAGPGDGQLIVWFPPFDEESTPGATTDRGFPAVKYCKVDVALATGQGVAVRDDDVLIALARGDDNRGGGVYRWTFDDFPTSDQPDGGCDATDPTGAPATSSAVPELFIEPGQGNSLATPNAVTEGPDGNLLVTSVINGVIAEFTPDGEYIRDILIMGADEKLGPEPYVNGTPLGIGVDANGNVFYADIGIVIADGGIGPGDGTGKVRRIAIVDGEPQAPEVMDEGLAFPDGIGIWQPS